MGARPVRPDYAFADLVFHELLHTWLVEHRPAVTPLLTKYAAEPPPLLAHLHLMALQKHVYTQLGRTEMLAWISAQYPRMRGVYPRAWQIVNEIEGYEAFIAELGGR
jgi:CRISPR/Cas system endoribonuclease Cas6 (RAMP superfamily)